jgi:hypothetical protein
LSRMKAKMPVLGSAPCSNFALTHAIAEVQGRLESSHRQAVLQYMFRSFSEVTSISSLDQRSASRYMSEVFDVQWHANVSFQQSQTSLCGEIKRFPRSALNFVLLCIRIIEV